MNIDDLRLLEEVRDGGSFAAAARRRDLDPSLVSRAVARIEEEIGIRVFQRSTRSLTLTDAGEVFLDRAQAVPLMFEEARQAALGEAAAISGTLRLTASHGFMQIMVLPLLGDFDTSFPELRLQMLASDANLDLTGEGIDLAIRLGAEITGDLVQSKLFDVRYRVVGTKIWAHRLRGASPADLSQQRCVVFSLPGSRAAWRFTDKHGATEAVEVSSRFETGSALAVRQMALDGHGPALMAEWCVRHDLAAGNLVDLFPEHEVSARETTSAAWLVYPNKAHLPAKTRAAIRFFREHLA